MKKLCIFVLMVIIPFFYAYTYEETEDVLRELSQETGGFDFYEFAEGLREGENLPSFNELLEDGGNTITKNIKEGAGELGIVIIPVVLFGILSAMEVSKKESGVTKAAFFGCFAFLAVILTGSFAKACDLVHETSQTLDIIHKSMIPLLFSLLIYMGNITQAVTLKPVVLASSQVIMQIITGYIVPFVIAGFALILTEMITGFQGLKKFGETILKITKISLVFMIILFIAILSAQSLMANSVDSVAVKGTKFAVNNFIPVVGSAISDGVETLSASMKVIKNSTGLAGIAGVISITFLPMLRIYAYAVIFNFLALFSFPVSDKRFGEIFSAAGNAMGILGSTVLTMSFVFIVTAAVIIGSNPVGI